MYRHHCPSGSKTMNMDVVLLFANFFATSRAVANHGVLLSAEMREFPKPTLVLAGEAPRLLEPATQLSFCLLRHRFLTLHCSRLTPGCLTNSIMSASAVNPNPFTLLVTQRMLQKGNIPVVPSFAVTLSTILPVITTFTVTSLSCLFHTRRGQSVSTTEPSETYFLCTVRANR